LDFQQICSISSDRTAVEWEESDSKRTALSIKKELNNLT
jgi:hypothetical protein